MVFNIIYFLLISLSVSYMWSFSEIFAPVRHFISKIPYIRKPFTCPVCSSFWFGFGCSFLYNPFILDVHVFLFTNCIAGLITHLCAVCLYKYIESESISGDKLDLRGKVLKVKQSEWNEFFINIKQKGSFNTFSVCKEDETTLNVYFS
jgi:hypothetical protein